MQTLCLHYHAPWTEGHDEGNYRCLLGFASGKGQDPATKQHILDSLERAMVKDNDKVTRQLDAVTSLYRQAKILGASR